jgi:outer membrane protein OmpA-like peptidoglycan-associated protein
LLIHELVHEMQQEPQRRQSRVHTVAHLSERGQHQTTIQRQGDKEPEANVSAVPSPTFQTLGDGHTLVRLFFAWDSDALTSEDNTAIGAVARELRHRKEPVIRIDGHASTEGGPVYNKDLSERRRQSVVAALLDSLFGVRRSSLTSLTVRGRAYGEEGKAGETKEERKLNRRVDIHLPVPELSRLLPSEVPYEPEEASEEPPDPLAEPVPEPARVCVGLSRFIEGTELLGLYKRFEEKVDGLIDEIFTFIPNPRIPLLGTPRDMLKDKLRDYLKTGKKEAVNAVLSEIGLPEKHRGDVWRLVNAFMKQDVCVVGGKLTVPYYEREKERNKRIPGFPYREDLPDRTRRR